MKQAIYNYHLIDKVCEWLNRNTYKHVDDSKLTMLFSSTNEMIEDFRKAMLVHIVYF